MFPQASAQIPSASLDKSTSDERRGTCIPPPSTRAMAGYPTAVFQRLILLTRNLHGCAVFSGKNEGKLAWLVFLTLMFSRTFARENIFFLVQTRTATIGQHKIHLVKLWKFHFVIGLLKEPGTSLGSEIHFSNKASQHSSFHGFVDTHGYLF